MKQEFSEILPVVYGPKSRSRCGALAFISLTSCLSFADEPAQGLPPWTPRRWAGGSRHRFRRVQDTERGAPSCFVSWGAKGGRVKRNTAASTHTPGEILKNVRWTFEGIFKLSRSLLKGKTQDSEPPALLPPQGP